MRCRSPHRCDITDIGSDGLVGDGSGWVQIANEMGILGQQVRTKNQRMTFRQINYCCIVTDPDRPSFRFQSNFLSDVAAQPAFAQVAEFYAFVSSPLLKRRGLRMSFAGFFVSSSAALKTLFISSTRMKCISFRMGSFT